MTALGRAGALPRLASKRYAGTNRQFQGARTGLGNREHQLCSPLPLGKCFPHSEIKNPLVPWAEIEEVCTEPYRMPFGLYVRNGLGLGKASLCWLAASQSAPRSGHLRPLP